MANVTASINRNLLFDVANFETVTEGLDYAARGETGINFFSGRGELQEALTYRDLRERAVILAQRFSKAGLQRGTSVAIIADTVPDFPVFFFACQYAGLIPVPLPLPFNLGSHGAYVKRLRYLIARSGVQIAVGSPEMIHYLKEAAGGLKMIGTPADFYALPYEGGDLRPFARDEPCYIQYSSGSTSLPRGVLVSQRAITSNARGIGQHGLKLRSGDRSASWLPLYHDMGLVGFCLTPMLCQITVDYLATKSFALRPLTWLKLLSQYGGTISFSPTFGYDLCVRRGLNGSAKDLDLSRWRVAGVGGDMVRADVLKRFADTFGVTGFSSKAFLPSYGLAESTLAVSFGSLDEGVEIDRFNQEHYDFTGRVTPIKRNENGSNREARSFVIFGTALPGHEVEIRNDKNDSLPDHQVGRIVIRGPSVMDGYYDDPAATAAAMTDDRWLDTGDLGYMTEGRLVVIGRRKDLVILNGRNIWPQDVEQAVEALEGLRGGDVACFSVVEPDGSEQMVAVLQCRSHDAAARNRLRKQAVATVLQTCGAYCRVVLVPPKTLKFTSSGKLSRSAVRQDFITGEFSDVNHLVS